MKLINKIFLLGALIGLVAFIGCSEDDLVKPTPSPGAPEGTQGVYFPTTNKAAFELMPVDPTEFTLTIARSVSEGAVDVPLTQDENEGNVFVVPASVSFAAGETETTFKVTFPTAEEGKKYNLKLSVAGDQYVNPYVEGVPYIETSAMRVKWEALEKPMVYVEGGFRSIWGGIDPVPVYVNAEKAVLGQVTRYRFTNFYNRVGTEFDEDGIYNGFPYNTPERIDPDNDYLTTIEIGGDKGTANEVFMYSHFTGVEWSTYGPVYMGSIYGNLTVGGEPAKKDEYPLGVLKDGIITFPENSLFYQDNDGISIHSNPTTIYLTKEIYLEANKEIKDFNDLEYELIEGDVSTFASKAFNNNWPQTLAKAVDIDEENEESAYKNLYYLADLYSDGYGVAFYYNEETGSVSIPENQPIGATVFGQDLYVSASEKIESSVEVKENGLTEYTLGMIFHYEDGTIVGDFAERYLYSEDPISYDIGDFVGNFTMTGFTLFQGEDDAKMKVKIEEGENENELLITGMQYAEEVVATFDPLTSMISIAPQALADFGSYDISLLTVTLEGSSLSISETAIINLQRNIVGDVILDSYSEAIGYVLESQAAGGYVDGYYDIEFTPRAAASSTSVQNSSAIKVQSALTTTVKEDNAKTHNFKVQGKKSTRQNQKMVKNEQIYYIFR